jgi:hypothetical protein
MGYDIADYEDIDPSYGTLADVDNLIKEVKKRDMKLVMDLVVNHTSEQVRPILRLNHAMEFVLTLLARLVSRFPLFKDIIKARLVYLETSKIRCRWQPPTTQQLGANSRRSKLSLDVGRKERRILPLIVHSRAARSKLGKP